MFNADSIIGYKRAGEFMTPKQSGVARRARDLARAKQFTELAELIRQSSRLDSSDLCFAEAFIRAGFPGDISLVKTFVSKGISIDVSFKGVTILHIAAGLPNSSFVRQLLDLKPDLNARDSEGATPLIVCTRAILRHQADSELVAEFQRNAQAIINADADLNASDMFRQTSLDYAFQAENAELAELLLLRGAQISKCSDGGRQAMSHAIQAVGTKLLSLLLMHGANPQCCLDGSDELPMVQFAAQHGSLDKVKMLISAGCPKILPDGTDVLALANREYKFKRKILRELGLL